MPGLKDKVINTIKARITEDLHIDLTKTPIHIKLEDNAVVMEGMVERIAHKKRALLIVMGLPGIDGVIDRLRVRPSIHMGDKEIAKHLMDALAEEPTIDASRITFQIKDGVVDIEGVVPSLSHKRLVGLFAWWVPGSMDVINSLEVEPPEEDTDDEVTDAVKLALEKDRLVDASSILLGTKDWVVTLAGTVRSGPEKETAEDDAWYIWGVNDVVNMLRVVR